MHTLSRLGAQTITALIAVDTPVKFQSDRIIINTNLVASNQVISSRILLGIWLLIDARIKAYPY